MSSKRKIDANRRNAQRSTGPKTPAGQAASARNAATHGLSSSFTVLPHEDPFAYAELLETLAGEFTPATGHEKFLVQQMAESRWRLERTRRFETIAYEQLLGEVDKSNPDHVIVWKLTQRAAQVFDLLQRYATAAERSYYKAHKELTQARAREKRNEANDAQLWLKAQVEQSKTPAIDDPIWLAPTPPAAENRQNEPDSAEIEDLHGPGLAG